MKGVVDVNCTPILGIDLWEHAYLADFSGDKDAYTDAFLAHVDWAQVSANFEAFNVQGNPTPVNNWDQRILLIDVISDIWWTQSQYERRTAQSSNINLFTL